MSKSAKVNRRILALALTVLEILTFGIFYLQKVGQGHGVQCSQWGHSIANVKSTKVVPCICALALGLTISEILTFQFWPSKKSTSRSQSEIFAITPFDGECLNLLMSFFAFFYSRLTCVNESNRQTDRHTDRQTHRNGQVHSIGENVQICLKLNLYSNAAF